MQVLTIDTSGGNCYLFAVVRRLPEQPGRPGYAAFLCVNSEGGMTCVEVGLGEIGSRTIPAEVKAEQSVVRVKPARK
jgi:hypothetical protein